MNRVARFLERVTPTGIKFLAFPLRDKPRPDGSFPMGHRPWRTADEGYAEAQRTYRQRDDLYFTPAAFAREKRKDPGKEFAQYDRHANNAIKVRALWLDVDFKFYDSPASAIRALTDSYKQIGFPPPSYTVESGGGVHVYWALEEELSVRLWLMLAQAFRTKLYKETKLECDWGVTTDPARVLRLPGSMNHKPEYGTPRLVRLHGDGVRYRVEDLAPLLQEKLMLGATLEILADMEAVFGKMDARDMGEGSDVDRNATSRLSVAAESCGVVAHQLETGGRYQDDEGGYFLWRDLVNLAAFCEDGEEFAHRLSDQHPGYDYEQTQDMYLSARAKNDDPNSSAGPTRCDTFASYSGCKSICAACPHKDKITTPWTLGMLRQQPYLQQSGQEDEQEDEQEEDLPSWSSNNATWRWVPNKEYHPEDNPGVPKMKPTLVAPFETHDWAIGFEEGGNAVLMFEARNRRLVKRVAMDGELLGDPRGLMKLLSGLGLAIQDEHQKEFMRVAKAWMNVLGSREAIIEKPNSGWQYSPDAEMPDGFVLGDKLIFKNGGSKVVRKSDERVRMYKASGSDKVWRELADHMVNVDRRIEAQVLVAASFAAPLISFHDGFSTTLNFWSPSSGIGKTHYVRMAAAIWGHPVKTSFALNDTDNAIQHAAGVSRDCPLIWDELQSTDDTDKMTQLLFRLTQGRTKSRLNSNAQARASYDLKTIMILASNYSMYEAMSAQIAQTEASAMRIMEIRMPEILRKTPELGASLSKLERNYGHMGERYVVALMQEEDRLSDKIMSMVRHMYQQTGEDPAHRFWVAAAAKILVAAAVARKAGLVEFDLERMRTYLISLLRQSRRDVAEQVEASSNIVAQILSKFQANVFVTDRPTGDFDGKAVVTVPADREPKIRKCRKTDAVYIPVSVVKEFCQATNTPLSVVRPLLKKASRKDGPTAHDMVTDERRIKERVWRIPLDEEKNRSLQRQQEA